MSEPASPEQTPGLTSQQPSSTETSVPRRRRKWKIAGMVTGALIIGILWFVPPVYFLLSGPITVTRWERVKGRTEAVVGPKEKNWTSIKKISRHALNAIIVAEDSRFYEHNGLDFEAIKHSIEYNYKKKRYARGGSTISQQVVKMAFLDREKTLLRKAREAAGTLLMEVLLPKEKILEWYINLAEFGDGVYSVAEGSRHYFKTKPEMLTIEQAVHLALVLPSPNSWSKGLRHKSLTPFGHKRFARILNGLRQGGYITKAQWLSTVTRGDFGRPIAGYAALIAAETNNKPLCPGSPDCPATEEEDAIWDEEVDSLAFPNESSPQATDPSSDEPKASESSQEETANISQPATTPDGSQGETKAPPATDGAEGHATENQLSSESKPEPASAPSSTPAPSDVQESSPGSSDSP